MTTETPQVQDWVRAHQSDFLNGWKKSDAVKSYQRFAGVKLTQAELLAILTPFGIKNGQVKETGDKVFRMDRKFFDDEDSESESKSAIDESDPYNRIALYVINSKRWQDKFIGTNPKRFAKEVGEWLADVSDIAMFKKYGKPVKSLKTIEKTDFLKQYLGINPDDKEFLLNEFDVIEFAIAFGEVAKALEPSHPEWEEEWKETVAENKKEARAARLRSEAEEAKRVERDSKLVHLLDEQKKEDDERSKMIEERTSKLSETLLKYNYIKADDVPLLTEMEKIYAQNERDIKKLDAALAKQPSKLTMVELNLIVEMHERTDVIKPSNTLRDDIAKQHIVDRIVYNKLREANKKFVGGEELLEEYEPYLRGPDIKTHYKELTNDEVKCYDTVAEYKLLAGKMLELYKAFMDIDGTDIDLVKVKKCAERKIDDDGIRNYIEAAAEDEYFTKYITEYFKRSRYATALLEHNDKYLQEAGKRKLEEATIYLNEAIAAERRAYEKELQIQIKADRAAAIAHRKEVIWAKAHNEKWLMFNVSEDKNELRQMLYDEKRHVMYYRPDPWDQTVVSNDFDIASLMKRPDDQWKEKDEVHPPDRTDLMRLFNNMLAVGGLVRKMEKKGLTTKQSAAMLMLMGDAAPRVEEPDDESNDEEDNRDNEIAELKRQLAEKEVKLAESEKKSRNAKKKAKKYKEEIEELQQDD